MGETVGDKSLLSQALEKGEDSASDTTGSERPGSASMDVKSESGPGIGSIGARDIEQLRDHGNALFPPGINYFAVFRLWRVVFVSA